MYCDECGFKNKETASWYNDYTLSVKSESPWFTRGRGAINDSAEWRIYVFSISTEMEM